MPVQIPVASDGERIVTVNTGAEILIFRTYFVCGQDQHWLLDIMDSQEKPLICGINLVPGVDNLLKGRGDALEDHQLYLHVRSGTEKDLEAPGKTMFLIWFNPGEQNPFAPDDPMLSIGL